MSLQLVCNRTFLFVVCCLFLAGGFAFAEDAAPVVVPAATPELTETKPVSTEEPSAVNPQSILTVAVVQDGACQYFDELTDLVQKEVEVLVDEDEVVIFKRDPKFNANWDVKRIDEVLNAALNDSEVDVVFAAGLLVAQAAGRPDFALAKPVISGFVQDPDTMGLPYDEEGHSTKKNFNFVVIPLRSSRDLEEFYKLVPYKNLGIVADSVILEGTSKEDLASGMEQIQKEQKAKAEILSVDKSASELLASIPESVDAIYLTPALRMSMAEWQKVIDGINAKKLPSFSLMGHVDVEKGVLAGLSPDCSDRIARRLALNIEQISMGNAPENLQVNMPVDEKLMFNAKTAVEIDYSPSLEILSSADIINKESFEKGEKLTMQQAVAMALDHNVDLAIQKAETQGSLAQKNKSLSTLLPDIEGNGQYSKIDNETAEASLGSAAEEQSKLGLSATQILFNDPAISSYRASKRSYESAENDQEKVRLNVIQNASDAFIQLLQARALSNIELENLKLTQSNLELARIRHQVGTSGPEEVYRWESQAASQRASVKDAHATVESSRIALNQTMGVEIDTDWLPVDIQVTSNNMHFLDGRIEEMLQTEDQLLVFEDFVVRYALNNAEELKSLSKQIEGQQIMLNQYKRRFVLPEFTASFTYDHTVDSKYAADPQTESPEDEWVAGVQATLPLFEGGGRLYDIASAKAQLLQLDEYRRQAREQIEQRVRTVMYSLRSTMPSVFLQREAADFSGKNLSVIKDKYARGVVSILDLLDAQNSYSVANQNAAIAVYSYLSDLVELQRSMSWVELEKTPAEKDAWFATLQGFMDAQDISSN